MKAMAELLFKQESYIIQGGCFEVYKQFRNRHKEKVYTRALLGYFKNKGLLVETEKQIPIYFSNRETDAKPDAELSRSLIKVGVYIPDIVINNCIFLELKCKPVITKDDIKQFWYYLKATKYKLGYLINFGTPNGVKIIRRVYDTARKI